ncbi:MAG: isoleucine--tRNA ligase, partial [Actinomycetia bacterium]|nr:isoleucine--tRNA ligase [Actinomycetes bacterium]
RLERWYSEDLYGQLLARNTGQPSYILHDGPPYANGPIHIGHAFNKILKDIIVKYHSLRGFYTPYVPGWDCHGQPIEHMVELSLGPQRMAEIDQVSLRQLCRDWATENINLQRNGFKRLGVLGDWDNPYLTYLPAYEAGIVQVFKTVYEKGAIYHGRKPIHWCSHCHTALAEAEIEYGEEPSPSVYVALRLLTATEVLPDSLSAVARQAWPAAGAADLLRAVADLRAQAQVQLPTVAGAAGGPELPWNVLIWTTTPWTLPANVAVSLAPEANYVGVVANDQVYLLAESLVAAVATIAGWTDWRLVSSADGQVWRATGRDLVGLAYHHPIHRDNFGVLIAGDHVELDTGSGAVHTSPGHGQDDYLVGELYGLPTIMPVDDNGVFDATAGELWAGAPQPAQPDQPAQPLAGLEVFTANPLIQNWLQQQGTLVAAQTIQHSYPHCWRCHQPVIFRATEQWFVSMDQTGLRQQALIEMAKLNWYPDWAMNRLRAMIETRPDWCISRQRSWGVPIPVFHCAQCGATLATPATFDAVIALFAAEGSDAWFKKTPAEYLPPDTHCEHCGAGLDQILPEQDILDVWWESGSSHTSVLAERPELRRPADLYMEGSDQHRGWFQSSLLTSVAAYDEAPYKGVMSCGFVVDEQGRKMSKSLGNGVDPAEVFEQYGADVLRLWVGSVDNSQDVSISPNILNQVADAYRRLRNTFRFLLANLADFDREADRVSWAELSLLDRWALARLMPLVAQAQDGYETNRFHLIYRAVYDYIVTDLSAVYLDALKDRLYSAAAKSRERRSAQQVLSQILETLVRLLAPILSFTCDEVWEYYPLGLVDADRPVSVLLAGWPTPVNLDPAPPTEEAERLLTDFAVVLNLREAVTKALEEARNHQVISKSQEALVTVQLPPEYWDILAALPADTLPELFIVSAVQLVAGPVDSAVQVDIQPASGQKCPRCWNLRELGSDPAHPEVCERCAAVLTALGV